MFYEQENEKYTCPYTGAHFKYDDLCQRLEFLREFRFEEEKRFFEEERLIQKQFDILIAQKQTKNIVDSKVGSSKKLKESGQSENFVEETIDERA